MVLRSSGEVDRSGRRRRQAAAQTAPVARSRYGTDLRLDQRLQLWYGGNGLQTLEFLQGLFELGLLIGMLKQEFLSPLFKGSRLRFHAFNTVSLSQAGTKLFKMR